MQKQKSQESPLSHPKVMLVQCLENMQNLSHPSTKLPFTVKQLPDLYPVSTRHTHSHTLGWVIFLYFFKLKILQRPLSFYSKVQGLQRLIKPCKICTTTRPCHLPSSLLLVFLFKKNYLIYLFGCLQYTKSSFLTRPLALGAHSLSQDFQEVPSWAFLMILHRVFTLVVPLSDVLLPTICKWGQPHLLAFD